MYSTVANMVIRTEASGILVAMTTMTLTLNKVSMVMHIILQTTANGRHEQCVLLWDTLVNFDLCYNLTKKTLI